MKWWRRGLVALTALAAFTFLAFYFRRVPDPVFQGKAISAWTSDLLNPDYSVRNQAQTTLTYIGSPAVPQLRTFLQKDNRSWQKLAQKFTRYVPRLSYKAYDAALCRERAAMVLAEMGPVGCDAAVDLIQCLRYPESVSTIEHALRRMGRATEPFLRQGLNDRNPTIREGAARLIGQLANIDVATESALTAALQDKAAGVRRQAALSFGELRQCRENVDRALSTALLKDSVPQVRESAAEALGKHKCRSSGSLTAVEMGMSDHSTIVRLQSAKAFWLITGDSARVLPVLIQLLETQEGWQANYVLGMLGESAAPAIPALVRVLRTERVPRPFRTPPSSVFALGEIGGPAVPALLPVLQDPDPHNRFSGVMAFGLMGARGKAAIPALLDLLRDKDDEVRHAAALTLGFIGADSELVVKGLAECLRAEDIYMRSTAVQILQQIAPSNEWVAQAE
jgi:HEAT repeat protein